MIPVIFYFWSIISVVRSALDALQNDDIPEAAAHIISGIIPRFVGASLILLFTSEWIALLFFLVIVSNSVFLFLSAKNQSERKTFTRTASFLTSIIVPVLVKQRISDKERGLDDEIDSSEKVKTQKTLGFFSLVNISVFLLTTSAFVAAIYLLDSFKTNSNNIVSIEQMMEIFLFVFLPSCGVAVTSSVLLCLIPAAKMKFSKVKTIIDLLIVIVAILIPVLSGIFLVNSVPRSVFVFLKVRNLIR